MNCIIFLTQFTSLYKILFFRNFYKIFFIRVHLGPVASYFVNRWGCRLTAVAGGMLLVAGLIGSYFSHSLWVIIATNGILSGLCLYHSRLLSNLNHFCKYYNFGTHFFSHYPNLSLNYERFNKT